MSEWQSSLDLAVGFADALAATGLAAMLFAAPLDACLGRSPAPARGPGLAGEVAAPVSPHGRPTCLRLDARPQSLLASIGLVVALVPVWAVLTAFGALCVGLFALGRVVERHGRAGAGRVDAGLCCPDFVDEIQGAPTEDFGAAPQGTGH